MWKLFMSSRRLIMQFYWQYRTNVVVIAIVRLKSTFDTNILWRRKANYHADNTEYEAHICLMFVSIYIQRNVCVCGGGGEREREPDCLLFPGICQLLQYLHNIMNTRYKYNHICLPRKKGIKRRINRPNPLFKSELQYSDL